MNLSDTEREYLCLILAIDMFHEFIEALITREYRQEYFEVFIDRWCDIIRDKAEEYKGWLNEH